MIRCLVADDHAAVLKAITQLLREEGGFDIVATARRGDEALAKLRSTKPDVAVLDARMPGMAGVEVARAAAAEGLKTANVIYTGVADHALLLDAADAGIRGFVLKDAPLEDLVRGLRAVAAGESYVDGALASTVVRGAASAGLPQLTVRERQVLSHLADGYRYEEIGESLSISPATVRVYVQRAMQRLDASTRTQAVAAALRLALIE
jgi:two-component system response regulator DesR